jgi:uncharacterized protein DUF3592
VSCQDIRFDLNRGETQLWAGTPRQGIVLGPLDFVVVPFGIMWTAFAAFWEMSVVRSKGPLFMQAFGAGFIAIGCFFTFGRLVTAARRRRRTVYGLTSDRVIIANGSGAPTSLPLATLGEVSVVEAADGSGNIAFGVPAAITTMFVSMPSMARAQFPMFEMIPDARNVCTQIQEAQKAAKARGGSAVETSPPSPAVSSFPKPTPTGLLTLIRFAFLLMFGGLGSFFAYQGAADWYAGVLSSTWQTAAGTVLDTRLVSSSGSGRNSGTRYSAHVAYMYNVGGQSFVGDKLSFGRLTRGSGYDDSQRLLQRYRRGTVVTIHYDPMRPERSVLEPGWTWGSVMMAAMGTLFALLGLAIFRRLGRPTRPQANRPPVGELLRMSRQQGAARVNN